MRIRTRHKLFKIIIAVAIIVFLVSLYDMFLNEAEWQIYILLTYLVLAFFALVLYIGHKPDLNVEEPIITEQIAARGIDEAPPPVPQVEEEAIEVTEVPKPRAYAAGPVQGPHAFRCPFCSQVFGLEATHLRRSNDFRIACPYCANNIRIPRAPKVAAGDVGVVRHARESEQVLFTCTTCGEVLRFTAPRSRLERALHVNTCPNCRSPTVLLATA